MLERLKHNWGYKLFSFFIAAILWLYVRTQQNPIVTQELKKEIEVRGLAPGLIITQPLPTVTLLIKAPKKKLEQINLNSLKVEISLEGKGVGTYKVPLKISTPKGIIVYCKVHRIKVNLDRVVAEQLPVQAVISSSPPEGFALRGIYINPPNVTVYLPSSQRNELSSAQIFVDLSRGEGDFMLPVLVMNKANKPIENAKVVPPLVKVSTSFNVTRLIKILPVLPDLSGSLPNNLVLERVEVQPQVVSVSGPSAVLSGLNSVKTEKIDLSQIQSSCSIEVPLAHIDKVTFLNTNKVTVNIFVGSGGQ
ncbi:hypothetical protein H5T87_01550 [bacterium]|nr:hypothetical protein [bacterium]